MAKLLYTAQATVTGGRSDGHGRTSDGVLEDEDADPPELGADGGGARSRGAAGDRLASCSECAWARWRSSSGSRIGEVIDSRVSLVQAEGRSSGSPWRST